ncbi:MAG: CGNR zinc finger domain-containing protein [Nocardioidaceae bacterium]|nr:CGNR zinc finger domain-containing protein [Nocardioidaceae bacterium]NUS50739.1 CGNR zinc finger domain-containing protein [Nocardioidaceae bacterium]
MLFSHDTEHSLDCVVDLVNTAAATAGGAEEQLPDTEALAAFVVDHDVSEVGELTETDLRDVQRLRAALAAVFDSPDDATAASAVNALVSRAGVTPRLTDHDGYDWHIHYFAPGASLAEHLAVDCGMALATVVAAGERERLRRCDAPDCEHVLVDLSRNRSRRYCDARTCGNRLHVAAYRERRRAGVS